MRTPSAVTTAASLAVFVLVAAGCSEEAAALFQPDLVNQTDTFSVQAGDLRNMTATEVYTWQNSGTTANVNQSGALTSGAATLTVRDADGATVYSSDLATTGTFETSAGAAGSWQVRLVLTNVSGDIDFSLQTP